MPAFSEVENQVKKDYAKNQAQIKAKKKASEIIADLKDSSQKPEDVAKKFGLTWQTLEPVSRTAGFVSPLGSSEEVNEMLTTLSESSPHLPHPLFPRRRDSR